MKKGETVYIGDPKVGARGPAWYPVCYMTSSGKVKMGYVKDKYLKASFRF